MRRITLFIALIVCATLVAFATVAGLTGKWAGDITLPDGRVVTMDYDFHVNGSQLTGTAIVMGPPLTINNGKVNDNDLSFDINGDDDTPVVHKGKYFAQGDTIALIVSYRGKTMHGTLKRVK